MSVRSHYSETSFMNTRATSGARLRKQCQTCIYRMQAEGEIEAQPGQKPQKLLTPIQQKRLERVQKTVYPFPKAAVPEKAELPSQKVAGLFRRFGNYIAKNQADLKAAGETTLMEDLSDAGKKMFNQAGQLGEEERNRILKLSQGGNRKESDDEVIDFMIGNRGGKK